MQYHHNIIDCELFEICELIDYSFKELNKYLTGKYFDIAFINPDAIAEML